MAYPHPGVPEFLHMDASEVAWELAVEAPECAAYLAGANFISKWPILLTKNRKWHIVKGAQALAYGNGHAGR